MAVSNTRVALSSQQLAFQGEGKVTVFGKEKEILALAEKYDHHSSIFMYNTLLIIVFYVKYNSN